MFTFRRKHVFDECSPRPSLGADAYRPRIRLSCAQAVAFGVVAAYALGSDRALIADVVATPSAAAQASPSPDPAPKPRATADPPPKPQPAPAPAPPPAPPPPVAPTSPPVAPVAPPPPAPVVTPPAPATLPPTPVVRSR